MILAQGVFLGQCKRPGLTPAIRAEKGWRGRWELAPRCSATQLTARRDDPGQTRRSLNHLNHTPPHTTTTHHHHTTTHHTHTTHTHHTHAMHTRNTHTQHTRNTTAKHTPTHNNTDTLIPTTPTTKHNNIGLAKNGLAKVGHYRWLVLLVTMSLVLCSRLLSSGPRCSASWPV